MSSSKVQIISNALAIMGKKPITTLENLSDIATAAEQAFDLIYPSIITKYFWRFSVKIVQLTQLNIIPVGGYWQYAYSLPGDYLKLVHLWPQNWDFEIYNNFQLYTNFASGITYINVPPAPPFPPQVPINNSPLYLEYQFLPLIGNLPDYFNEFFAYEIAAYLCLSNAQSVNYFNVLRPRADFLLQAALAADAQNRPQTPLQSAPMISRRNVSTFASG